MELLRDIRRAMGREVKKGNCPLMFDRLEFGNKPFQMITSEEKLDEVLAWLLRIKTFQQYAEKTIINNVYMDNGKPGLGIDMLCKKHSLSVPVPLWTERGFMREYSGIKSGYSRIMTGGFVWKQCGASLRSRRGRRRTA